MGLLRSHSGLSIPLSLSLVEKANKFKKHSSEVGMKSFEKTQANQIDAHNFTDEPQSPMMDANTNNSFRPYPVDMETLILTIKELRATNSCGSDGIQYRFIIDSLPVIIFYLLVIVNTSIVTGKYPTLGNILTLFRFTRMVMWMK